MCGVLVVGVVSPVWAGEAGEPGAPPVVELGSFGVGDGLEGVVNEVDGSFGVVVPVAGVSLGWDSRVGVDRYGFGVGWGLGFAVVEVEGGVRVSPASGGVFEAAGSVPSGLLGYAGSDVVFRQVPGGVLPGRADGVVGEQSYAFELHELGGVITYFNAAGDPVAKVAAGGDRSDWGWVAGNPHRLGSVVSVDGVVTELDWSDPGEVLVRPGVNVPAEGGGAGVWRVQLADGRVGEVADPVGGRSLVGYDRAGRVERVVSGSGAVTTVSWRSDTDAVSRVDRVAVTDATGTELSAREWRQVGGVLPSGWPAVDPASVPGAVAGAVGGARSVEVSDGKTRVVSSFDEWGRLAGKQVVVTSAAGEQTVQEQELTYPDGDPVGVGDLARKPVAAEVRSLDVSGGVRAGTEAYEYDDLGRMVRRTSADGTVLERAYDPEVPTGRLLPVGSPVSERSTAPDGSVTSTETTLDDTRTVPVLVEQTMHAPGGAATVTGRTEYTVEGGAVIEQREFPSGAAGAAPVVTRWDETINLERGVREVVETVAAGTELAASTSSTTSLLHGGALESTDVLGRMSSAQYDELGRPVLTRDAADRVTTTAYAPADGGFGGFGGDQVTVTGPDGVAVTEVRDVLGRVVQKHDNLNPDGDPVAGEVRVFERHGFPAPGVEEITDAWGATTRVEQDVHGRAARATLANGLVQVTEHDDVHGTVTTGTTPTGRLADAAQVRTSRMDVSGRETGTDGTRADGVPVPETSTVYDGFGRELQTSNGATRTSVEFDAHGNPATTTISPEDPAAAADALVAERRFDGFGTSLEKTMSAGGQERSGGSRELDVLGRTVTETDQVGAITGYEYTVDGLPERVTTSAGQVTTYAYDDTSRAVIEVRVEAPGQQAVVTGYAYDEVTGRVTAVFDPAERVGTEITYSYDGFGNIRTVQYPAEHAGAARPAIAHEYDRHGRKTLAADGSRYEWDAANRQIAQILADGTRIDTRYWADGLRKSRATEAGSTTYYWDDTTLVNDTHVTADQALAGGVASYLIGASRHARTTQAEADAVETRYYSTDRHGNVTGLTDEAGAGVGSYRYSDYGVATAGTGIVAPDAALLGAVGQLSHNPYQYASEYTHPDGTQFLRERTYDPRQLSFTSKDRESLHDRYGYANANPIMFVDPSGRMSLFDQIALGLNSLGIVLALAGAAAAIIATGGAGIGLTALGVTTAVFGVSDAVFTAVEAYSMATGTRFMSEEDALAVGAGLAGAGLFLGVGGALIGLHDTLVGVGVKLFARQPGIDLKNAKATARWYETDLVTSTEDALPDGVDVDFVEKITASARANHQEVIPHVVGGAKAETMTPLQAVQRAVDAAYEVASAGEYLPLIKAVASILGSVKKRLADPKLTGLPAELAKVGWLDSLSPEQVSRALAKAHLANAEIGQVQTILDKLVRGTVPFGRFQVRADRSVIDLNELLIAARDASHELLRKY